MLVLALIAKSSKHEKRETAALGAGEKLVLGHPLAATIGDSARCMQNLEKGAIHGAKDLRHGGRLFAIRVSWPGCVGEHQGFSEFSLHCPNHAHGQKFDPDSQNCQNTFCRDRIAPNCTIRHPVWPIVALQRRVRFSARLAGFCRIRWHQRRARRAERRREVMLAVYEGSSSSTGTTCFAASPTFWASRIRAFSSGAPFRTTMPDDGSKNFFSFCILCG